MVKERFAGVDWASEEHAVCVVDERGRIVDGRRYRHDEPGIRALCARLLKFGVALVALERPDGLLTWRLLDAGLSVIAVHPNQVRAMRPRYSVAGGKSDGFDSFVLAELARTDHHRFRILVPDSDRTKALRAMTKYQPHYVRCADRCPQRWWSWRRRIRSRGARWSWMGTERSVGSVACWCVCLTGLREASR
jgi:hypothetical protein